MPSIAQAETSVVFIDQDHHLAVCRGLFCAVCDLPLPTAEGTRGKRLCAGCWPDASVPWYNLHAALMWSHIDGWTLCICWPTPERTGPEVSTWHLLHDRAECLAILDRHLCCQRDRATLEAMGDYAGHCTVGLFVTPRRLAALADATREDSRTAYEKRHGIREKR